MRHPFPPRRRRSLPVLPAAVAGALLAAASAGSQEPAAAPAQESGRLLAPSVAAPSGATRLLGPPLFPLYYHYQDTGDGSETLHVLFPFYSSRRLLNGDSSRLLLPFFYSKSQSEPRDDRLMLFPLLYFRGRDAEGGYDLSPFYWNWEEGGDAWRGVLNLWIEHDDAPRGADSHHILFPLARYRAESTVAGERGSKAKTGFRLGLWKVLELADAYGSEDEGRFSVLGLLNWGEEAQSPFALFHHRHRGPTPAARDSRTHLFPFYWQGDTPSGAWSYVLPFFGYSAAGGDRDLYLPALLARVGWSDNGAARQDFLWPLYQRRYGPGYSAFTSFPFYRYSWTLRERRWGLGPFGLLYENTYEPAKDKTAQSWLWPLGSYDVEPDGVDGSIRSLPFYFDTFNDARRWRVLLPLWLNFQRRDGTKVDWSFNLALPTYLGWGAPNDYFGVGFPLFWQMRDGLTGWDLFLPFYYGFFSSASYGVHVLPLFSINSYPSELQLALLGPLFVHRRYYGYRSGEDAVGSATSVVWPLTAFERRPDGYHYRLLPLFWTSRERDAYDLLIFPWYRQWGGGRDQHYLFPIYGSFRSQSIDRDFFLLGTYIQTRQKDEHGATFRRRHDVLWPLWEVESNDRSQERHWHFLPLGLWSSSGISEDRHIAAPFYYGHRIETEGGSHRLDLVLGNLWLDKEVHRALPPLAVPVPDPAAAAADPSSAPAAAPLPRTELISSEKGILWPLWRWGQDEEGGRSQWVSPFYFHRSTDSDETHALFPFFFRDHMEDRYALSFFRYFFLADYEDWQGGWRFTLGQLLFDWKSDAAGNARRWRFLYPLVEHSWDESGYSYLVTPFWQGSSREDGGEITSSNVLFPVFWQGSQVRRGERGADTVDRSHVYLFPLYGLNYKSLRTQHDFLLPFFHIEHGLDSFRFQMRPLLYIRDDPEETSVRLWPLVSVEVGESAGEWWVSKYLYFAKSAVRRSSWSFRLDPFLYRAGSSDDATGAGGLFELWAYDREGGETSFRALPLTYGYARANEAGSGFLPFYYGRDFGDRPIQYFIPWRPLFLVNHLRGADTSYWSLLTLLAEYESNARRPHYSFLTLFFRFFQSQRTETSSKLAVFPLFYYDSDDAELRRTFYFILPLYRYEELAGQATHYILWGLPVWWSGGGER